MTVMKRTLTALLAAIMTVWVFASSETAAYSADGGGQKPDIVRFGGADRYETAALIADAGWTSSETVFLANSDSYADALAGAPLAHAYSAPILLTDGKSVNDAVMSRIKKLGAKNVFLLGGKAAVSEDIENKLKTDGYKVTRVWGGDRYETALKIAEALAGKGQAPADIFIASGENYPDALSASSPAAIKHAPILYVPADGRLDKATADFISKSRPANAYILGGAAAVGKAAENAVKSAGAKNVERLGGGDRYETSLKVARQFDPQFKRDDIAFATGKNFPDALAGSVFAARESIPVLLTDNSAASDGVKSYIAQRQRGTVYIFGGQAAVSDSIIKAYFPDGGSDYAKGYADLVRSVDYGDKTTYVIGHKSPDSDTVGSAIAYAAFLNELGIKAEAAVSGKINNETKYALNTFGVSVPGIVDSAEGKQFVLVDHSAYSQAISGMKNARIVGVVDHHGIGDVMNTELINVRCAPAGSTCTIVYLCYKECGVDIPRDIARVMLMGLMSDTSNGTSSMTEMDTIAYNDLVTLAGLADTDAFYKEMHKASMSYEGMTESEIYHSDYKEYEAGGYTFGMATFTVSGSDAKADLAGRMLKVMEDEYDSIGMDMLFAKVKNETANDMYMTAYGGKAVETLDACYSGTYDGSKFFIFDKNLGRKGKLVPAITAYLEAHPKSSQTPEPSASVLNYSETWDSLPEDYKLVQAVVFSRHNIRAPLSGNGSVLASVTPHKWFEWTSNPSELSLRGGVLETEMGQYFRKYLESQGLIPENYIPEDGAVRFYANTKQRCIATAQYFSSGMMPVADVMVERAGSDYSKMDPVFHPQFTFVSESYKEEALRQIAEMGGTEGMSGIDSGLSENYRLLADIIDLEQSEAYKNGSADSLVNYGSSVNIVLNDEPTMNGSLKLGCQISDALVLQYYEEPDELKAAFGKKLTAAQWDAVSKVKDTYNDVLFTAPIVSSVIANPLLKEIESEMSESGRKFSFLCGHDSNIASMLAALGVKEYSLPDTIEKNTPIGSKVVFSTWENGSGQRFVSVNMVYQSTGQLRSAALLTLSESPVIYPLSFNGIEADENGLYPYDEFRAHLAGRIGEYDRITAEYSDDSALQAAA